jgi:hypothetical protein
MPLSSADKKEHLVTLNMAHIIDTCAFQKVNKPFERLTITADVQNVSLVFLIVF